MKYILIKADYKKVCKSFLEDLFAPVSEKSIEAMALVKFRQLLRAQHCRKIHTSHHPTNKSSDNSIRNVVPNRRVHRIRDRQ
jgi:hypothetical protein